MNWIGSTPRFTRMTAEIERAEADQDDSRIRDLILASSSVDDQKAIMQEYLHGLVARVLRTTASKIDIYRQLMELGLDSLMAVELINRLEGDLKIGVPSAQLNFQSIHDLTALLLPLVTGKK